MITYAQNFEDFMLWKALKAIKNGLYIDIGACDPDLYSVTKWFYDNGWSGINAEPIEECYRKFLTERPRDINLDIFVSDKNGVTDFYESSDLVKSTNKPENAKTPKNEPGLKFEKKIKNTRKLDDICAEHGVKTVHFLKIDVEGSEMEVLRGFSFDEIRPWIVLFESVSTDADHNDVSTECVNYLKNKGYHFIYFDGLNKFFAADEHPEMDAAFNVPLSVLDENSIKLNEKHFLLANAGFDAFGNPLPPKNPEVEFMKSSKFWKMREKYMRFKKYF